MLADRKNLPREERIKIWKPRVGRFMPLFMLDTTNAFVGYSNYEHEMNCAEFYVSLANHTDLDSWQACVPLGSLIVDRVAGINGCRFNLEMDMGNEPIETLCAKIDGYMRSAGSSEKVVFLLKDGRFKAENNMYDILSYANQKKLGEFVSAAYYVQIIKDPLGQNIASPFGVTSFQKLCSS